MRIAALLHSHMWSIEIMSNTEVIGMTLLLFWTILIMCVLFGWVSI